jgi:phosphoribosylformimino-5-aminoimidazole carboxamide ribotide isomerase
LQVESDKVSIFLSLTFQLLNFSLEELMYIIPAIDLIGGKCVRLTEGDFDQKKIYNADPVETAFLFKELGAKRIHIVDLDGAKTGNSGNREIIKKIKKESGLIVETGGGIRSLYDVKDFIDAGIDFLILGTILTGNIGDVKSWFKEFGKHFIAGIDVKNNVVMTHGWQKDEGLDAFVFGKSLHEIGFTETVFTDISKDGKLQGPNIEGTRAFSEKTGLKIILSGGVSSEDDIRMGKADIGKNLTGIIIGKAYYEGKINLAEVIKKYQD